MRANWMSGLALADSVRSAAMLKPTPMTSLQFCWMSA